MQIISYIIDVYYGKVKVCKNIFDFCTYILFFPQLIAGPIVRYNEVEEQLKVKNINIVNIYYGIITFVFGLAYKVILANQLSLVAVDIDKHFENMNFSIAWLSAICYILQLYFDFYGYSLMAIGLGKIIGFNLPINFRTPLLSKSISEFWTRWHITLNTFLRDYIYIPLGGSKNGIVRTCINLFVVFLISGIWHGAYYNYILFGISFGILIIIERIFLKKFLDRHKVFSHIYTVFFVVVIFVFFANEDMNKIFVLFKSMFTFSNGIINESLIDILKINWKQILLGLIFATNFIQNRYTKKYLNKNINIFVVLILFIISIYLIFIGSNDPFLYFRF